MVKWLCFVVVFFRVFFFEDRSLLLAAVKEDGRLLRLAPLTPLGKPVGMDWKGGVPGKQPELPQKRGV